MDLLPDTYPSFFCRTVHRWHFDMASFSNCVEAGGSKAAQVRFVHPFGIANAMRWLHGPRPGGRESLPHFDNPLLDKVWTGYLESISAADYLCVMEDRRADDAG